MYVFMLGAKTIFRFISSDKGNRPEEAEEQSHLVDLTLATFFPNDLLGLEDT